MQEETRRLLISLLERERVTLAFISNPAPAHRDQARQVEAAIRELQTAALTVRDCAGQAFIRGGRDDT